MNGKRLAELRQEAGLSQEALGYRAGIHGVHVHKLEVGKVKNPGVGTLQDLADVLSEVLGRLITVDDLLNGSAPAPTEVAS